MDYLKLAKIADVKKGFVIRQPKAYPIYNSEYRKHLNVIRQFLDKIDNLYSIGRNGMHRYNNQDHSMLTGILAAENILGQRHDIWSINENREYHEK